jgi:alkylhydroperoxidase family enzyme
MARKLTFEPHRIGREDYLALRKHWNELETFEIIFWVSSYNVTNRWTEGLSIPLEPHRKFLVPMPDGFKDRPSQVAPLVQRDLKATPVPALIAQRPRLESRAEVEAALAACRKRKPYLTLVSEKEALAFLPEGARREAPGVFPDNLPVANWMRLYAIFPKSGGYRIQCTVAEAARGKIEPRLWAQIDWICARHDRAWYAVGQAKRRLLALGETEDAIYALDGDWKSFTPKEQLTFAFVRKMTVAPAAITDADVAGLRKLYTDTQVAELVYRASLAAMLNRAGEACGLPLED